MSLPVNFSSSSDPMDGMDPAKLFACVDFFFNWVDNNVLAKTAYSQLIRLRKDLCEVTDHDMEIRYFPCKFISKKLIETFLSVILKEEVSIKQVMAYIRKYGKDMVYLPGFEYILLGIQVYMNAGVGIEGLKLVYQKLESKVAVLAVRQFYLGIMKADSLPQQMSIIRKVKFWNQCDSQLLHISITDNHSCLN